MQTRHHLSINIQGLLRNFKNKKINFFNDDNGNRLTDKQAREEIKKRLDQGHKLICTSNECEGFDPFEKGCPGHSIEE